VVRTRPTTSAPTREPTRRPTRAELLAAVDRTVPDLIAPDLAILFAGINPGLYTAWSGHHFARPGNRFWPTLHAAGFTDRVLHPSEEHLLLPLGYGITNLVARTTATAAELTSAELRRGGATLRRTVLRFRPRCLAVLGVSAYRAGFDQPDATIGRQPDPIGDSVVWVLPNPSGLNAHYQLPALARLFRTLRTSLDAQPPATR